MNTTNSVPGRLEDLKLDKKNTNKGTEKGDGLIDKSIREFGIGRGIVADKDGNIIGGNHITKKAKANGIEKVIFVETTGDTLVVTKRMDIDTSTPEGLRKAQRMALADNATQVANFSLDIATASDLGLDIEGWGLDINSYDSEFEVKPTPKTNETGDYGDYDDIDDDDYDDDEYEGETQDTNESDAQDEPIYIPDAIFPSNNAYEIPTLDIKLQAQYPELPFKPYGAEKRSGNGVGTYHFYVDDYRFEAIWKDPSNIIQSGCVSIVEPNLSLFDTTPIAYGLHLIYKKRWIAKLLQTYGIKVFADLNVSQKFADYNKLGIPEGWNAFFTRGYADRIHALEPELQVAKDISGLENPNLIVYGGGNVVRDWCQKNNLTHIADFMSAKVINP
jgi:hypothetical protein